MASKLRLLVKASMSSSVNIEVMAATNARKVSPGCQKLAPSSNANMTPPMGAPKAAATPAAVPHATKSRFSLSFRNCWMRARGRERAPAPPLAAVSTHIEAGKLRVEADGGGLALGDTGADDCAAVDHGALFAHGEAASDGECDADHLTGEAGASQPGTACDSSVARALVNSVLRRTTRGSLTPLRYTLISGMPLPAANGSMSGARVEGDVGAAAGVTRSTHKPPGGRTQGRIQHWSPCRRRTRPTGSPLRAKRARQCLRHAGAGARPSGGSALSTWSSAAVNLVSAIWAEK